MAVPQKQRGSFPWIALLIALLILLACFFMFQSRSAVGKEGNAGPPALAKEELAMPDDVRAWLEHLRKIEEKKQQISIKQIANLKVFGEMLQTLGPGIGNLDPYGKDDANGADKNPTEVTQGKFQDLRPEWQDLVTQFQSVPPPAECKPLADNYFKALNEIPAMTGDLVDVLNKVQSNPQDALQSATALKSKSYGSIDLGFNEADGQLSAICAKYHTTKWFNIKADVMGGGMLGASGSLGGGSGGLGGF